MSIFTWPQPRSIVTKDVRPENPAGQAKANSYFSSALIKGLPPHFPPSAPTPGPGASRHAYTHQTSKAPEPHWYQSISYLQVRGKDTKASQDPKAIGQTTQGQSTTALTIQIPKQVSTHFHHSGSPQLLPVPNSQFDFLSEAGLGDFLSEDSERQGSLQCEHVLPSLLLPAEAAAKSKLGRALAPDALPFGLVPLPPGRHCSLPKQPRISPHLAPVPARAGTTQEVKHLLGLHRTAAESGQRMTGPQVRPLE